MQKPITRVLIVIVAWQLSCGILSASLGRFVGEIVLSAYTWRYGDVQESFATYWRIYTYVDIFVITALATVIGVVLLVVLERRRTSVCSIAATFFLWHAAAVTALLISDKYGLYWAFHQLDNALFGPTDDLYSFRNAFLPRIVAWVTSSTAAIGAVLWLRSRSMPAPLRAQSRPTREGVLPRVQKDAPADENPYHAPQSQGPTNQ